MGVPRSGTATGDRIFQRVAPAMVKELSSCQDICHLVQRSQGVRYDMVSMFASYFFEI